MMNMNPWFFVSLLISCSSLCTSQTPSGCGSVAYYGSSGTIVSPNYPSSYPASTCMYYFVNVTHLSKIFMTFQQLNLEYNSDCSFDWIEISCSTPTTSGIPVRYCGTQSYPNLQTLYPCTVARVWFRSDGSVQYSGFVLQYQADKIECVGNCSAEATPDGGYTCPCDPGQSTVIPTSGSPPLITCPVGCLMNTAGNYCYCPMTTTYSTTTTQSASTTPACGYNCYLTYDYVGHPYCICPTTLFCGYGCYASYDYFGNRYCVCSTTTSTTLGPCNWPCYYTYQYDQNDVYRYMCSCPTTTPPPPPTGCNQTLGGSYGIVTSSNYPNAYPRGIDCYQYINIPQATSIRLKVIDLYVYYYDSNACAYDYVEIIGCDGSSTVVCTPYGLPQPGVVFYCTESSVVTVIFHASNSSTYSGYRGFKFVYSANYGTNCSDSGFYLAEGSSGVVTSPYYPAVMATLR